VTSEGENSISAYGTARSTVGGTPLDTEEIKKIDAYWQASLYLCLGMLYLKENPLLRQPLELRHLKPRLLGHWGSDAGQAFTYIHFNRLINKYDLNAIYISGPGHGAPAVLSQAYLEGTYSEVYPDKSEDAEGMRRFFEPIGNIPPVEIEQAYYDTEEAPAAVAGLNQKVLRETRGGSHCFRGTFACAAFSYAWQRRLSSIWRITCRDSWHCPTWPRKARDCYLGLISRPKKSGRSRSCAHHYLASKP